MRLGRKHELPVGAASLFAARGGGGAAITIDGVVAKSGNVYTFTARRTTGIASPLSAPFSVVGSSAYGTAATAADFGGTFPSGTINFIAGSATATFSVTGNSAVQPE